MPRRALQEVRPADLREGGAGADGAVLQIRRPGGGVFCGPRRRQLLHLGRRRARRRHLGAGVHVPEGRVDDEGGLVPHAASPGSGGEGPGSRSEEEGEAEGEATAGEGDDFGAGEGGTRPRAGRAGEAEGRRDEDGGRNGATEGGRVAHVAGGGPSSRGGGEATLKAI